VTEPAIEGRQHALSVARQCQEIRVSDLAVTLERTLQANDRGRYLEALRPELVSRVREVLREQRHGVGRRKGIPRERRVRDDPDEAELCEGARGPARLRAPSEPLMGSLVVLMSGP